MKHGEMSEHSKNEGMKMEKMGKGMMRKAEEKGHQEMCDMTNKMGGHDSEEGAAH